MYTQGQSDPAHAVSMLATRNLAGRPHSLSVATAAGTEARERARREEGRGVAALCWAHVAS